MATMAVTLNEPNPVSSSARGTRSSERDAQLRRAVRVRRSIDARLLQALVPVAPGAARERRVLFDDRPTPSERAFARAAAAGRRDESGDPSRDRKGPRVPRRARRPHRCRSTSSPRVVGLSASHLQRSFKRVVGVSPKEYQYEQQDADIQVASARRRHGEPSHLRSRLRVEQPRVRARVDARSA